MIEQLTPAENTFRVSAAYGVMSKEEALLLDKLLRHLSALAHPVDAVTDEPKDKALRTALHERYGFDINTANEAQIQTLIKQITEECVTLVRALGALRSADSLLPLDVPSVMKIDHPGGTRW